MAREMTADERREFLSRGTRTAKLATTMRDGSPHVMPVWFVLEGDELVFNTGADTVKGRNLTRDPARLAARRRRAARRSPSSTCAGAWR